MPSLTSGRLVVIIHSDDSFSASIISVASGQNSSETLFMNLTFDGFSYISNSAIVGFDADNTLLFRLHTFGRFNLHTAILIETFN